MKKAFVILLSAVLLAGTAGCGAGSEEKAPTQPDSKTVISKAIEMLSNAESYELKTYNEEETVFGDKKTGHQTEAITRAVADPYTVWSKSEDLMTRIDGEQNRSVHETYQTLKDDKLTLYIRYSYQNGPEVQKVPALSKWEKPSVVTDKSQIDSLLRYNKNSIMTEIYLLKANIDSFHPVDDTAAESKGLIRYEGSIDPATVVEAYGKYLRKSYIEMKFVLDKKNPSTEDLKNEIIGGRPEFQVGPTKLAFSESPVPVTLWIEGNTFTLKKVTIDETSVLLALQQKALKEMKSDIGDPEVKKASMTYEIISLDQFDEIPAPESLRQ